MNNTARRHVRENEPIGNITPAPGWHAIYEHSGKWIEEPIVGWMLMRVRVKTYDHNGRLVPNGVTEEKNEIHGVVSHELGFICSASEAENFVRYRGPDISLEDLKKLHDSTDLDEGGPGEPGAGAP